jgi:diacylglycerol kinase family enzyme
MAADPSERPGPDTVVGVDRHRLSAIACLGCLAVGVVATAVTVLRTFPRGLVAVAVLGIAVLAAWEGVRRRGGVRTLLIAVAAGLVVVSLGLFVLGGLIVAGFVAVAALAAAVIAERQAFALRVVLPAQPRPSHPVVVWNPRSGGGKALRANLAEEARARGIEPIELGPDDDLIVLVKRAVADGADALAAAGGDGTQALVAAIAAEHDLPFACVPAGTRNHLALDLGVDRDDVVGALDALVSGGERRVDLAEVNGRTFVNNVSLGLYADAVQRKGYRDAKMETILDIVPDWLGPKPSDASPPLRWAGPDGLPHEGAVVILVSNNTYRLGRLIGSGTRPRIDEGLLGVVVFSTAGRTPVEARPLWRQWSTPSFTLDAAEAVPAGVDGEAMQLEPPLRFVIRRRALRVRIAPQHPGASPSAAQPATVREGVRQLGRIAAGRGVKAVPHLSPPPQPDRGQGA